MNTKSLELIGLTEEQAKIYLCLILNGRLPARKISLETNINRSLVYKILDQLIKLELVEKTVIPKSVGVFTASHPSKLDSVVKKKESDLEIANRALNEIVVSLSSAFNLVNKKPSVRFYEGVDGIKTLHKDIIFTGKDIKLIRSPLDKNTPELEDMTRKQVRAQAWKKIHTKVIAPKLEVPEKELGERDKQNLVDRCEVPEGILNTSAQILIYGDRIGLTSFKDSMITTIIENKSITETFSVIFDSLWEKYKK